MSQTKLTNIQTIPSNRTIITLNTTYNKWIWLVYKQVAYAITKKINSCLTKYFLTPITLTSHRSKIYSFAKGLAKEMIPFPGI